MITDIIYEKYKSKLTKKEAEIIERLQLKYTDEDILYAISQMFQKNKQLKINTFAEDTIFRSYLDMNKAKHSDFVLNLVIPESLKNQYNSIDVFRYDFKQCIEELQNNICCDNIKTEDEDIARKIYYYREKQVPFWVIIELFKRKDYYLKKSEIMNIFEQENTFMNDSRVIYKKTMEFKNNTFALFAKENNIEI